MNLDYLGEEIEDLLFFIDVNQEILTNEKIKYYTYFLYYVKKIRSLMDISNFRYLNNKLGNILLSTNQLIHEADTEHMFWNNLVTILEDTNAKYIYDDIEPEIEDLIVSFSELGYYRNQFFEEYKEAFDKFLNNPIILEDSYFLSDLNKDDCIDKLNNYRKKLELVNTKK